MFGVTFGDGKNDVFLDVVCEVVLRFPIREVAAGFDRDVVTSGADPHQHGGKALCHRVRHFDAQRFSDGARKVGRGPFNRVVGIRDGVGGKVAGDDVSQYARFLDAGRQLGGKTRVVSLCGNAVRGLGGKSDEGGRNGGEVSTEGHDRAPEKRDVAECRQRRGRSFVGILGFCLSSVDSESKDDGEAEKRR